MGVEVVRAGERGPRPGRDEFSKWSWGAFDDALVFDRRIGPIRSSLSEGLRGLTRR